MTIIQPVLKLQVNSALGILRFLRFSAEIHHDGKDNQENFPWPFHSQDLISNSPNCLLYSSCDISLENLVLDQLIIPYSRFFLIHVTCLLDIVRKNSRKCIIVWLPLQTRKYSLSNHAFNCWLRITGMGLTAKWWEN